MLKIIKSEAEYDDAIQRIHSLMRMELAEANWLKFQARGPGSLKY